MNPYGKRWVSYRPTLRPRERLAAQHKSHPFMTAAPPSLSSLQVSRTARIATLGSPEEASVCWIALHGYGQLAADFIEPFGPSVTAHRCVVAPEALSRFYVDEMDAHEEVGASWMTRDAREDDIQDYLRYLDRVVEHLYAGSTTPSIRVLGFSQGTATASRWALLGNTTVDRLVLWGGAPAHDLDLETHAPALRQLDLTIVLGTEDPYVTDDHRSAVRAQLARHDIPVTVHTYEGGHHLHRDTLSQVLRTDP